MFSQDIVGFENDVRPSIFYTYIYLKSLFIAKIFNHWVFFLNLDLKKNEKILNF